MLFIGEFMVVEHEDEVGIGDVIRKAKVVEIPKAIPGVLRKENYYGEEGWAAVFSNKDAVNKKIKEVEKYLSELKKIAELLN